MAEISIIIPVYNSEKYLKRCLDSIIAQTFRDFEIILVDDGSKDNSGSICDYYSEKYEYIHTLHQKNSGAGTARNVGIDLATNKSESKWIHFIDADDWVHPQMLEILYKFSSDDCMVVCNYKIIDKNYVNDFKTPKFEPEYYTPSEFLYKHSYVCHMPVCKLIDIRFFENCKFPDGKLYEDVFLMYKLFYKAKQIVFIDFPLYFYFNNPESSMNSVYSLKKLDEVQAGEEQVDFFKKVNDEKNLIQAYKRLMYYYDSHMKNLKAIDNGKHYYKKLKRKLSVLLITKAKFCDVSIKNSTSYYESAFPVCMGLYWKLNKIKSMLLHKK